MNKDGSTAAEDDKIRSAPTILRVRTKESRILRITLPDEIIARGISSRFLRNLATIASSRSGRSHADGHRAGHLYHRLYRQGQPLKKLLPLAAKILHEEELEVVTRSLMRDKKKAEIGWPDIDVVICFLDDAGTLAHCSAEAAAEHVTSYLHDHGVPWHLRADAYRKRVERLRRDGIKF
jgi:YD repeat-containing protein